jgi:hypothetical protein
MKQTTLHRPRAPLQPVAAASRGEEEASRVVVVVFGSNQAIDGVLIPLDSAPSVAGSRFAIEACRADNDASSPAAAAAPSRRFFHVQSHHLFSVR